jgi:hypothetical protein
MAEKPPKSLTSEPYVYLFGLISGFLLSLFTSKFKTPPQKSVDRISPKDQTNTESEETQPLPYLPSQIPPAPSNSENSCHCCHHKTPRWKIVLDVLTLLVTAGAFVAAAIYAGISYEMWKEMQTQTINSERAWVGLDVPITIDAIAEDPTKIMIKGHYTVKNFGHGPALKEIQRGNFVGEETLENQTRESQFFCDSVSKFATGTVPMVRAKQPSPFGRSLFPGQSDNGDIEYQGPVSTGNHLRFIGCVAYLDQFKAVHWTMFCMEKKPGDSTPKGSIPKLDYCAMYNETDQQNESQKSANPAK